VATSLVEKTYKPIDYYFRIGQKVRLRKRAPNFSREDEKRAIKKGLAEIKEKFGNGPFYVTAVFKTPADEMENVGHPQELCLSKTKGGKTIKDNNGKSVVLSAIFFRC